MESARIFIPSCTGHQPALCHRRRRHPVRRSSALRGGATRTSYALRTLCTSSIPLRTARHQLVTAGALCTSRAPSTGEEAAAKCERGRWCVATAQTHIWVAPGPANAHRTPRATLRPRRRAPRPPANSRPKTFVWPPACAVPKSIDNDVLFVDRTFGFDSAVEAADTDTHHISRHLSYTCVHPPIARSPSSCVPSRPLRASSPTATWRRRAVPRRTRSHWPPKLRVASLTAPALSAPMYCLAWCPLRPSHIVAAQGVGIVKLMGRDAGFVAAHAVRRAGIGCRGVAAVVEGCGGAGRGGEFARWDGACGML